MYLKINDILEYNPPYVEFDFTCNTGPTDFKISQSIRLVVNKVLVQDVPNYVVASHPAFISGSNRRRPKGK